MSNKRLAGLDDFFKSIISVIWWEQSKVGVLRSWDKREERRDIVKIRCENWIIGEKQIDDRYKQSQKILFPSIIWFNK